MPYANTIFHLSNVNPRLDLKHNNLCRTSWLQFFEHLFVSNQAPWDYLKVKEFLVIFSMRVNTCLQNHFLLNRELQHLTSLSVIVPSFFSFFFFKSKQDQMIANDSRPWCLAGKMIKKNGYVVHLLLVNFESVLWWIHSHAKTLNIPDLCKI